MVSSVTVLEASWLIIFTGGVMFDIELEATAAKSCLSRRWASNIRQ